jgi:hypothetical protein
MNQPGAKARHVTRFGFIDALFPDSALAALEGH